MTERIVCHERKCVPSVRYMFSICCDVERDATFSFITLPVSFHRCTNLTDDLFSPSLSDCTFQLMWNCNLHAVFLVKKWRNCPSLSLKSMHWPVSWRNWGAETRVTVITLSQPTATTLKSARSTRSWETNYWLVSPLVFFRRLIHQI